MNVLVVIDAVESVLLAKKGSVVPNFSEFEVEELPKVIFGSVLLEIGSENPEEPNLILEAWETLLTELIPKLIDDEGVVSVAAAATRVENLVLGSLDEKASVDFEPGREAKQQAQAVLSDSFDAKHVLQDHLLEFAAFAAANNEFTG